MRISLRKLNCILLVLAILLCMTVEIRFLDAFLIQTKPIKVVVIVLCLTGIMIEIGFKKEKISMQAPILIAAYLIFYAIGSRYNIVAYLEAFLLLFTFFFLYNYFLIKNNGFLDFLNIFTDILIVIGCITVFFWLFGSVLDLLPGRTQMTYTWANETHITYTYYLLYFENPIQNVKLLGISLPRNCGIFTEAPAYSGIILYGIGIELFARDKIQMKRLIPLLITVLTIQSTKAFIILIMLFTLLYFQNVVKGRNHSYKILHSLIFIALIVIASFAILYIITDKASTSSYLARMNHLASGLKTWLQNPVFGAGFRNKEALMGNQDMDYGYGRASMGLTILLAYGGLYLFLFYVFAYFYAQRYPNVKNRRTDYKYFSFIILMNLFVSNSAFTLPYLFMIAAAYAAGAVGNNSRIQTLITLKKVGLITQRTYP